MSTKRQLLKLIIVGDSGVGKTSLMHRYVERNFDRRYKATVGADFLTKDVEIEGRVVTLQIWDTAGQERFQSLGSAFYRGADACVLVFDVTQQETFAHVGSWLEEFSIQAGRRDSVLVGNKIDLEDHRQVASTTVQAWCAKQNAEAVGNNNSSNFRGSDDAVTPDITYFEASAKDNAGVEEAFLAVTRLALARKKTVEETAPMPQTVNLSQVPAPQPSSASACSC